MESLEAIKERIEAAVPGAVVEIVANQGTAAEHSLALDHASAVRVAEFLRDDPALKLDYCSNVTGVDWLDSVEKVREKVTKEVAGESKEVVEVREIETPGYLESVYHLYSMELKHGPVVLRLRTGNRSDQITAPSLTPVWRAAELQEREIFDLYGIVFENHPDLRRLLMWDEFEDHPMRRDYVEPDDYDYEPTPHDEVLDKARAHHTWEGDA